MLGLANYLGARPSRTDFVSFSEAAKERLHEMLDTTWSLVGSWPDGFREFLERYQQRIGTSGTKYGAEPAFGQFYTFIRQAKDEPWLTVKKAFVDFLETTWDGNAIPRPEQSFKSTIDFRTQSMSIAEAARAIGRSTSKVKHLIELGIFSGEVAGDHWGAPIFIPRAEVERLAPDGAPPVRLDEVGAILGLSRQRQRQFVDGDVLVPVLGPKIDGSKVYLFRASDAHAILNDIAQHADAKVKTAKTQPFADLIKGARTRGFPLAKVIEALRKGVISAVAIDDNNQGLNALIFEKRSVLRLLTELQRGRSDDDGERELSIPVVARRLGISDCAVAGLLEAGHLASGPNKKGRTVTRESVQTFESTYAFTSQIAKSDGTVARWKRASLLAQGIPVIDCGEKSGKTSFVERRHLGMRDNPRPTVVDDMKEERGGAEGHQP